MEFKDKRVVITGASGLVGYPTVIKCLEEGALEVIAVDIKISDELISLKSKYPIGQLSLRQLDLTYFNNCESLFSTKVDICLHLAGIKGSPSRAAKQPADYLFPMMMFNTNMIKAAFEANVKWFVYTSSVGVYQPADVMEEDSVWKTLPSEADWFPSWSKRMGEVLLEAYKVQYDYTTWESPSLTSTDGLIETTIVDIRQRVVDGTIYFNGDNTKLFSLAHPMFIYKNGKYEILPTALIEVGDYLVDISQDGSFTNTIIESIGTVDGEQVVYQFDMEPHDWYVSGDYLVHNK